MAAETGESPTFTVTSPPGFLPPGTVTITRTRVPGDVEDGDLEQDALVRSWCCGTPLTGPHTPGCDFEPREDNPVDYTGPAVVVSKHQPETSEPERHQIVVTGMCPPPPSAAADIRAELVARDAELAVDMVNHPPHYSHHPSGVECIAITRSMTFDSGNATKYVYRADAKNGREDVEKARWYLVDGIGFGDEVFQPRWSTDAKELLARVADHEVDPVRQCFFRAMRDGDLGRALGAVNSMLGID